jgi:hypothetical protein
MILSIYRVCNIILEINNSMFKTAQFPELALAYLVWYGENAMSGKQYFESHLQVAPLVHNLMKCYTSRKCHHA